MQKAIDMVLPETARMMVEAFERRANERLNPAD
jgi:ribosome-associated toxin RatA of RatAB toxin-antitoxin module